MKNKNIRHWVVIVGEPVFVCKTRKQAREYAKGNDVDAGKWNYIGKCINDEKQIILDI